MESPYKKFKERVVGLGEEAYISKSLYNIENFLY